MVYISPPRSTARPPHRATYSDAYASVLASHRRSPMTAASSVVMLVAPDVDALCAARMLSELFRQDDVMYRAVPVNGFSELFRIRDELVGNNELHTLILINIGAMLSLPSDEWFGDLSAKVTVHVIDPARPLNLDIILRTDENGDRVVWWDDGTAEELEEKFRESWDIFQSQTLKGDDDDDDYDSDENDDFDEDDEKEESDADDDDQQPDMSISGTGKRKPSPRGSEGGGKRRRKRQRVDGKSARRYSRDEIMDANEILDKYYVAGTWYGQSSSATIYILATALERTDEELLWLAILGLTHQYISSRISRTTYEKYQSIYADEVARLDNTSSALQSSVDGSTTTTRRNAGGTSSRPDDHAIRTSDELRFTLFRHWTLYDAMYHSAYVAAKLGIWREKGRKRLTGLLAKMGFSTVQTQQPYVHMDMELKRQLRQQLDAIAPEYGLVELTYPGFTRASGWRGQPLSAADTVEGIAALLDIPRSVKLKVEQEGARNGGEWFGGEVAWEDAKEEHMNKSALRKAKTQSQEDGEEEQEEDEVQWWVQNFWTAFDALGDTVRLRAALPLSKALHRAIIRQGSSIIDKQEIKPLKSYNVVVLSQGPDLPLFCHATVLQRLAYWLVDALRDRIGQKGRRGLPIVVACLDEQKDQYVVVGVTASFDFGEVRKNQFSLAFNNARAACGATIAFETMSGTILRIKREDLKMFLDALSDNADGY